MNDYLGSNNDLTVCAGKTGWMGIQLFKASRWEYDNDGGNPFVSSPSPKLKSFKDAIDVLENDLENDGHIKS